MDSLNTLTKNVEDSNNLKIPLTNPHKLMDDIKSSALGIPELADELKALKIPKPESTPKLQKVIEENINSLLKMIDPDRDLDPETAPEKSSITILEFAQKGTRLDYELVKGGLTYLEGKTYYKKEQVNLKATTLIIELQKFVQGNTLIKIE